jgi:hypothetical protein
MRPMSTCSIRFMSRFPSFAAKRGEMSLFTQNDVFLYRCLSFQVINSVPDTSLFLLHCQQLID